MKLPRLFAALALAAALAAGCGHIEVNETAEAPAPAVLAFDGLGVLAGPPAAGSAQQAGDVATSKGPWSPARIAQAAADDALDPWQAFAPILGADFTAVNHPATKRLFDQILAVAGPSIGATKARWQRHRPFVASAAHPTCIAPTDALRASGSYPSGHAALGWAWALALAEIAPAEPDAILARGFQYGESRVVCGLHWQSDVNDGRALGAAALARMHADPGTRALFDAARAELAR